MPVKFLKSLSAALLITSGAAVSFAGVDSAEPTRVVATFSILGEWVERVGGDKVIVNTLIGRDGDAHVFDETARDLLTLKDADLIVANGLALEPWLQRMVQAAAAESEVVYLAERLPQAGYTLLKTDGTHCSACSSSDDTLEHDPHVWLDPAYAARMVQEIAAILAAHDPDNSLYYEDNATAYVEELHQLHLRIEQELADIPPARRVLVVHHDSLRYFAERYRFTVPGSLMGSQSTEGGDPAARQLVRLVRFIRDNQIPAVFAERSLPGDLPLQVAREAGLPKPLPLYTGALGPVGSDGENYIAMMIYNAGVIRRSLSQ